MSNICSLFYNLTARKPIVFRPWVFWRYIAIACISCDFLADILLQMLKFWVLNFRHFTEICFLSVNVHKHCITCTHSSLDEILVTQISHLIKFSETVNFTCINDLFRTDTLCLLKIPVQIRIFLNTEYL